MNIYVPRTCTEVVQHHPDDPTARPKPKPLREFADRPAIVLLGAPGAGKTEMFRREAKFQTQVHEGQEGAQAGCYITARDFVTFDERPEWHGKTLFIDGLDEMRAGTSDQRTPFDQIRAKLDNLGRPPFRLSCREADWFGAIDRTHLESVSPNSKVLVLRLDPLSGEGIRKIVGNRGIKDVEDFISTAKQRGIEALLENPQTLEMLVTAVAGGHWPETRAQTFELACRRLLSEHNPEHQLAAQQQHSDEVLLDAAGHLCALLLLSGRTGCHRMADQGDAEFISLSGISTPSQDILNRTIHTKLFNVENGLAAPIHRHIAEFLAGRHLAGLIDNDGLPVGRILALITGEDGGLVSELRGLAAWLAAHNRTARSEIIKRDPQGMVLYGDVKQFSVAEKRQILTCLEQEAEHDPWDIASNRELDPRWGDLATPDMENAFSDLLLDGTASDARQSILRTMLTAIYQGAAIPNLKPVLMKVVRDEKRPPRIKELALDAYIKQAEDNSERNQYLKVLLKDVHSGTVSDPNDQLLGCLLTQLYPDELPPSEIGRYFKVPKNDSFIGRYTFFWTETFKNRTANQISIADALDSLVCSCDDQLMEIETHFIPFYIRDLPTPLLATFLTNMEDADALDVQRLFSWLCLSSDIGESHGCGEEVQAVKIWFENHPSQYKAIFKMGIERSYMPWTMKGHLFSANPPPDFGSWCLDQALKTEDQDIARKYFDEAVDCLNSQNHCEGLSRNILETRVAERSNLLNHYNRMRDQERHSIDAQEQQKKERSERQQKIANERRNFLESWRNAIRSHEADLRENSAPPMLLHKLADVYFRPFMDIQGNTGRERLFSLLGGDERLVDLVLNAFRKSTTRSDLPKAPDILRLASKNELHPLTLPFVAGLHELGSALQAEKRPLDEEGMRRAFAICFGNEFYGARYDLIAKKRPDLAAEVLVQAFQFFVRNGKQDCAALHKLNHGPNHAEIARLAALQLARLFPVRCTLNQLGLLKSILLSALQHGEKNEFLRIVEEKLALNSLDAGQKIYWLTAGVLALSASFTNRLADALSGRGKERRVRHLADFAASETHGKPARAIAALDLAAKETLIRFIGAGYRPWRSEDGWVANEKLDAPALVRELIHQVSSNPSPEAFDVLARLLQDALLKPWHPRLRHAAQQQRGIRREACFTHATPEQVQKVLQNGRPANSADLAAVTMDHLVELAKQIQDGATSDWRQYWNTDHHGAVTEPKHEDRCRDTLLSDLVARLTPLGVGAQPEGQYAKETRADIRVGCNGFNIPVEIKKNTHRNLWTAIRSQLIAQYARDPGANGHGIYLVFWFGPERTKAMPPTGARPNTAKALEESLCVQLSAAEARKISVVVVDVAQPAYES